jgi:pyridoxal 5'-phosphate synthase pdxT subunit
VTRLPGERLDRPRGGRQLSLGSSEADAAPVGVLALQGDVLEHARALAAVGLRPVPVRTPGQLAAVEGLVLPGGESTAIARAIERAGLSEPLASALAGGLPVIGTCAGLILLSDELTGDDEAMPRPRGLAIRTERNAYGPQTASFDVRFAVAGIEGGPMEASFIRAPRIDAILDPAVEVLATVDGAPVAVRQGAMIAMTFHPEVSGDHRLHALFAGDVRRRAGR